MAKNNVRDWDTTASNNTDIAGIGIQGTNLPSNFDNALRTVMKQIADVDGGTEPVNDTWSFCDPADTTKIFRLDAGSITTASTRVITVPDASTTLVGTGVTQTLTNKTFTDSSTSIADNSDATKIARFECSGITTGTTRTYTFPDASSTIAVLGLSQTWTAAPTFPTATTVSGTGFTTLDITSTGAASDPVLSLNSVAGSWTIRNDEDASNVFDFRWNNTTKCTLSTSGTMSLAGTAPILNMTDSDSGATSLISGNSVAGSLFISADSGNTAANSVMTFSVDGTENARYGGASYVQTWGGLSAVIDPTSGSTDGMTLSSLSRLVRSVDGYQPFQQRRRTSDGVIQEFYRNTTMVGTISVTTTNTAYNTSSDERLKHDFQPIDPAILDAIKVYDFAWNSDNSRSYGVKAQELDLTVPQAVFKGEDPDNDMWSVDYSKLVPILVAALQDARERISALEAAV